MYLQGIIDHLNVNHDSISEDEILIAKSLEYSKNNLDLILKRGPYLGEDTISSEELSEIRSLIGNLKEEGEESFEMITGYHGMKLYDKGFLGYLRKMNAEYDRQYEEYFRQNEGIRHAE